MLIIIYLIGEFCQNCDSFGVNFGHFDRKYSILVLIERKGSE
jgi:hypothetical protein